MHTVSVFICLALSLPLELKCMQERTLSVLVSHHCLPHESVWHMQSPQSIFLELIDKYVNDYFKIKIKGVPT